MIKAITGLSVRLLLIFFYHSGITPHGYKLSLVLAQGQIECFFLSLFFIGGRFVFNVLFHLCLRTFVLLFLLASDLFLLVAQEIHGLVLLLLPVLLHAWLGRRLPVGQLLHGVERLLGEPEHVEGVAAGRGLKLAGGGGDRSEIWKSVTKYLKK